MATTVEGSARAGGTGEGKRWDHPVCLTALYHEHVVAGADLVERDGWLLPRSYGNPSAEQAALREAVGLRDIGAGGKIDVKSDALDAVLAPLRRGETGPQSGETIPRLRVTALNDGVRACRLTDQQALLLTDPAARQDTFDALDRAAAAETCAHVTDLTGALCAVRLLGPRAPAVLERLSSLDLAPDRFADGALAQGGIAGAHALVARRDEDDLVGYDVFVDRDLGAYLWETLLVQGAPLGIRPVGDDTKGLGMRD